MLRRSAGFLRSCTTVHMRSVFDTSCLGTVQKRWFLIRGAATVIATPPAHAPGAELEQLTKIIGALPLSARLPRAPPGDPVDTSIDSVVQTRCGKLHARPS